MTSRPRGRAIQALGPIFDQAALQPPTSERTPAFGELGQIGHENKLVLLSGVAVKQPDQAADRPFRSRPLNDGERVAFVRRSFLQHAPVPACAAGALHVARHAFAAEPQIELEARLTTLRDLQQRAAETGYVADTDIILRPARGRQVFAEGAGRCQHRMRTNFGRPCRIVLERVLTERLLPSPMMPAIALGIAYHPFPCKLQRAGNGAFGETGRRSDGPRGSDTPNQHDGFEWDHQAAFAAGAGQTP